MAKWGNGVSEGGNMLERPGVGSEGVWRQGLAEMEETGGSVPFKTFGRSSGKWEWRRGTPLLTRGPSPRSRRGIARRPLRSTAGVASQRALPPLVQVFLRYLTANGRLAEFFGPGPGNSHLDSDLHTRKMLYTEAEMEAQYRRLSARTRTAYQGFTRGVQVRDWVA